MAVTYGKWESLITVPTGGWSCALTEVTDPPGGGASAAAIDFVAAKTYYHSSAGNDTVSLAAKLKALLDAEGVATYTVTCDDGEGGTGRYTISATGGSVTEFAITWDEDGLRDVLGFTTDDDLSGALTYTSTDAAQGLWLPDGPPLYDEPGDESDETVAADKAGTNVHRLTYSRIIVISDLVYQGLSRGKSWIAGETYANESYQRFWRDAIQHDLSYLKASQIRWYPDAATDGTHTDYWVHAMPNAKYEAMVQGWRGLYNIRIPRLTEVP